MKKTRGSGMVAEGMIKNSHGTLSEHTCCGNYEGA